MYESHESSARSMFSVLVFEAICSAWAILWVHYCSSENDITCKIKILMEGCDCAEWHLGDEEHIAFGKTLDAVMLKGTITFHCWSQCLPNGQMVCKYVIKSVRQSASQGSSPQYTCWSDILFFYLLLGLLGNTLAADIPRGCNWGIPTGHLPAIIA